jgi:hypothetical protein
MTSNTGKAELLVNGVKTRKRTWHELAVAMLLLLEISLLVPWLRAISSGASGLSTLQVVLILMFHAYFAHLSSRLFAHLEWGEGLRVLALFGLFVVSLAATLWLLVFGSVEVFSGPGLALSALAGMLINFSNGLVVILSVLYAWWRGLLAARAGTVSMQRTSYRFRMGVLLMGLFGIVFIQDNVGMLFEILPFFFGAALLAMALSRADTLESTNRFGRTPFTRGWLVALLVIVGLMLLTGAVANAVLQTPLARELVSWFVILLLLVATIVLSPLLLILYYVIWLVLAKFFEWFSQAENAFPEFEGVAALQNLVDQLQQEAVSEAPTPPAWWVENAWIIQAIAVVLGLVLLAYVAMRIGKRIAARREELALVEGEDLFSGKGLLDSMKRGLERAREILNVGNLLRTVRREIAASSIRRVYARLLELAETQGRSRMPSETPEEFLEALHTLFPDHTEQSTQITDAYVLVRYGEFPEDLVQPALVFRSWRAIRDGVQGERSRGSKSDEVPATDGQIGGNDGRG